MDLAGYKERLDCISTAMSTRIVISKGKLVVVV